MWYFSTWWFLTNVSWEFPVRICFCFQEKNYLSDSLEEMKKMTHKEKVKMKQLENAIMEKIHSQLMFEKSSQYTNKLTDKTKEISQQLVSCISSVFFFFLVFHCCNVNFFSFQWFNRLLLCKWSGFQIKEFRII